MAKSQIIKDLATNKISLDEGLQRLLVISNELNIDELNNWLKGELSGYMSDAKLPDYRKNIGSIFIYSGISGSYKVTNSPLPKNCLPKEILSEVNQTEIRNSIRSIEKLLKDDTKVGIDLTYLANIVYENTGIQCYRIFMEYNRLSIEEIISNVKIQLILLLLDIEKEFGNLDNLDIDTKMLTEDRTNRVKNSVGRIFYDNRNDLI